MSFEKRLARVYKQLIYQYSENSNEQTLYQGQNLSRKLIEHRIAPEEVVSYHKSILLDNQFSKQDVLNSFDLLLEVMMGYGLAYREHQSLRVKQLELQNEIEVAAKMQQTLLGTMIPNIAGLDIGAISMPAKQMNGDYHHFRKDEKERLGIAIADVIGKGIPAALAMSMIKYSIEGLPETQHSPKVILENLNRVVEQNVDASMFITMCYGVYNPHKHIFTYASAGHEPGFYYNKQSETFHDLNTKGLLLGIEKKVTYLEYEQHLQNGDMIILLSDGVTECRTGGRFIERDILTTMIAQYIHLSAQEIVTNLYKDLERLQEFELRDDFTLIILKRIG